MSMFSGKFINIVHIPFVTRRCATKLTSSMVLCGMQAMWTCASTTTIELTFGMQCGGNVGYCGTPGYGPCVAGPWPGYSCEAGLSCLPDGATPVSISTDVNIVIVRLESMYSL